MQFINIVVHSTEDMNFRVHLQHEFTLLALDKYLDVSVFTVYTTFAKQVSQYMYNCSAREVPGFWCIEQQDVHTSVVILCSPVRLRCIVYIAR